uniref:Uncharacterized protein n=1 Tax=Romanomermis culicivorax TaxID=13658 RepID=A0A915J8Z8_ROMCU
MKLYDKVTSFPRPIYLKYHYGQKNSEKCKDLQLWGATDFIGRLLPSTTHRLTTCAFFVIVMMIARGTARTLARRIDFDQLGSFGAVWHQNFRSWRQNFFQFG